MFGNVKNLLPDIPTSIMSQVKAQFYTWNEVSKTVEAKKKKWKQEYCEHRKTVKGRL